MPRIRHLGTLSTATPALITLGELPPTATTPKIPVVVKTYLRSDVAKHNLIEAVQAERTALVRLATDRSGLVARLLSANVTQTSLVLTMARAPGVPAATLPRPMPPRRAARIVRQLAAALQRVHAVGVVHADVTLRNVLVDTKNSDSVCLVDFSACFVEGHVPRDASRTTSSHVLAPEVLEGRSPDPTADIWALGVFLWALLFGGPGPFESQRDQSVLQHLQEVVDKGFNSVEAFRRACSHIGVECSRDMLCAQDFLAVCLSVEPRRRFVSLDDASQLRNDWSVMIDFDRILSHRFLAPPD